MMSYAIGVYSLPNDLVMADVNRDGNLDALVANYGADNVGVLLGTGTGAFGAITTYSTGTGSGPFRLAVADVNGDDVLDILTANYNANNVGVLLGTSTGTFGMATTYSTGAGSQPSGLAVSDVNADGKPDVLTANSLTNSVGVLLGTGTGSFAAVATYSAGPSSTPFGVVVADVNADGQPDVLTANSSSATVGVLLGTGTGTFGPVATYLTGGQPRNLTVADVNRDGQLDVLTANNIAISLGVLLGTGTGSFGSPTLYGLGFNTSVQSVVAADMNGDSKLDLLTASLNARTINMWLGTGTGTFGAMTTYSTGIYAPPACLAVADVNGDGKLDVLTANNGNNTLGVFLNTTPTLLPTRAALLSTSATLYPNPARSAATLTTTGLPAAARTVEATLLSSLGQVVHRLTWPAALGAATGDVPTAGLAAGLYLVQLSVFDAQGAALGALPTQRLSVK
jgi:hypothetical protein